MGKERIEKDIEVIEEEKKEYLETPEGKKEAGTTRVYPEESLTEIPTRGKEVKTESNETFDEGESEGEYEPEFKEQEDIEKFEKADTTRVCTKEVREPLQGPDKSSAKISTGGKEDDTEEISDIF